MGIEDNNNAMYGKIGHPSFLWPKSFIPDEPGYDDWLKGYPRGHFFIRPELAAMTRSLYPYGKSRFVEMILRQRMLESPWKMMHIGHESPDLVTAEQRITALFKSILNHRNGESHQIDGVILDETHIPHRPFNPMISELTYAIRRVTVDGNVPIDIQMPTHPLHQTASPKPRYTLWKARSLGKSIPMIFDSLSQYIETTVRVTDGVSGDPTAFQLYPETNTIRIVEANHTRELMVEYPYRGKPKPAWNPPPKFRGLVKK